MIFEEVEMLPECIRKVRGHRNITNEVEDLLPHMKMNAWYVIKDHNYNNSNDLYRVMCCVLKKLDYPADIKMRNGNVYLRRKR